MEQEITILQLMKLSVEQLSAIAVPAGLTEQIAMPVMRVINNLKFGIQAIEKAEAENSEAPQLELVPAESVTDEEENPNG